jgi:hypothetical protein
VLLRSVPKEHHPRLTESGKPFMPRVGTGATGFPHARESNSMGPRSRTPQGRRRRGGGAPAPKMHPIAQPDTREARSTPFRNGT